MSDRRLRVVLALSLLALAAGIGCSGGAETKEDATRLRKAVLGCLKAHRPAVVVRDFDSELAMAREVEALWPSERTTQLRETVESGR